MKKKFIFLMLLCAIFISKSINVHASEAKFYEGGMVEMFVKKITSADPNTIYYQNSRFFHEVGSGRFAYCVEPEKFFDENTTYYSTDHPYNLTQEQIDRIKLIGYFGYLYPDHRMIKWYAVAQLMIWQTADPNGSYYFTDTLNGNRTNKYDPEIQEINNLINNYLTKPNINIPTAVKSNRQIELTDTNNIINNYETNIGSIRGNKLIIDGLTEGEYTIKLKRKKIETGNVATFYESYGSQNMFLNGDLPDIEIEYKLIVANTKLQIKKVNSDTKDSKDVGAASLKDTKFGLYNKKGTLIRTIQIDKTGTATIDDLDFGTYKIKELEAGNGYKLNDKEYIVKIDANNLTVEITIENDIIKKEITIHKTYGSDVFVGEPNVTFEIYDEEGNLIDTVTTDESGYIKFSLTYGTYTLKQVNSKEGYTKVEPIKIEVKDEDILILELKDYKIKVPNTHTEESLLEIIIKCLMGLICVRI